MSVCSVEFLLLLILGSAIFPWIPTVRLRQMFLSLCNAGFLYSLVPNAQSWLALGLFLVSGYLVSRILRAYPSRRVLAVHITIVLAAFLILKRYRILVLLLPEVLLDESVAVVGLSYMFFRQIHVAVDTSQGQIANLSFWTFVNYQLNFFALVAGPIQRYQNFSEDWNSLAPVVVDEFEILHAYMRISVGVIKIALIAPQCLKWYEHFAGALADPPSAVVPHAALKFLMLLYLYPAYVYFNFSGYCDIVIAGARLYGMRMPENFNSPFLARNMIDYWTRWHMTLGMWFRDYVFTPIYMAIAWRWPGRASSLAFVCYFVTLFLTGVWHGATWNFVIFGILNGLGVSAAKLWEMWLVHRLGRQGYKAYLQSKPIHVLAVVCTFHFVCVTNFFFPTDLERSNRILHTLITSGIFS